MNKDNKDGKSNGQASANKLNAGHSNLTANSINVVPERNNIEDDFKGTLMALWK